VNPEFSGLKRELSMAVMVRSGDERCYPAVMNGVTTALTGFILLALAFPKIIKNKAQYYVALVCVCAIIVLESIAQPDAKGLSGFQQLVLFVIALLQLVSLVSLVLAAGGLSMGELATDLTGAYEVIRRGEEEKEIIIPLPDHIAAKAAEQGNAPRPSKKDDDEPKTYVIDAPATDIDLRKPPESPKRDESGGAIPLK
jgi:hypothetical protein